MALENDIEALVNSLDLELYDISILKDNEDTIYRVSVVSNKIDNGKREGVSLDKCVELSHLISPLLDVNPPISSDYRLEVGSAGIERKIATLKQYIQSIGEKVSITLKDKTKHNGTLLDVQGSNIIIKSDDDVITVEYPQISRAKTYFEW